jgi:hypothetical protein
MEDYLKDSKWVCGFEKPQTDPSAFERPATTVLSPYLKFGCLSPRLFHSRLVALYHASKGPHSKPPVSLRGQLLWREFFYTVRKFLREYHRYRCYFLLIEEAHGFAHCHPAPTNRVCRVFWAELIRHPGTGDLIRLHLPQ